MDKTNPSSDMEQFKELLRRANKVFILTGAGISAESGIPTFRGSGGLWRSYDAMSLANPEAFEKHPSLVWEFYNYRRELVKTKSPNAAHYAIAKFQKKFLELDGEIHLATQNIDELHTKAGSTDVIELHGSMFRTKCMSCSSVQSNYDSPICEAFKKRLNDDNSEIAESELPRCPIPSCNGLLRPAVTWFGEALDSPTMAAAYDGIKNCDLCIIIGTSSVVYPAAAFGLIIAKKFVPVAEFNLEPTVATDKFRFHFQGPCSETVPEALAEFITDKS